MGIVRIIMTALCRPGPGGWQPIRVISILVVLAATIAIIGAMDRPSIRYAEYRDQCNMIYRQRGPVDLVAIGSSRSMRAFQATTLERLVTEKYGFKPVIHDLSRAYRDPGHMLVFISDYLDHHEVKVLLVEFKETGPQWRHPYYERTAPIREILASYFSRPSIPAISRVQALLRDVLDRTAFRVSQVVDGELSQDCASGKTIPARTTDGSPPYLVNSELLANVKRNGKDNGQQTDYEFSLEGSVEERNIYYMTRIAQIADAKGVSLFFYYIPQRFGRPLSKKFVGEFERRLRRPLLQLPADTLERIHLLGYTDGTHMGWGGADAYMSFLANALPWSKSSAHASNQ